MCVCVCVCCETLFCVVFLMHTDLYKASFTAFFFSLTSPLCV